MPLPSFSGDQRRRVSYVGQAGATSLKVPLHSDPGGDMREGMFRVPRRMAHTAPDTNQRHEFEGKVRENFNRWCGWLEKRGWEYVAGTLQVNGPYDEPTFSPDDPSDEDVVQFRLLARFRRTSPLFVGLDDFTEIQRKKGIYGVGDNPTPWSVVKGEDSGWVNPMEFAQKRREALGLQRGDYLLGPLDEPR